MPGSERYADYQRCFTKVEATTEGGSNTVIAAVEGRRIVVFGYLLTANAEGLIEVKSGSAVLAKLQCGKSVPNPFPGGDSVPAFEGEVGAPVAIVNPASTRTYGHITYGLR